MDWTAKNSMYVTINILNSQMSLYIRKNMNTILAHIISRVDPLVVPIYCDWVGFHINLSATYMSGTYKSDGISTLSQTDIALPGRVAKLSSGYQHTHTHNKSGLYKTGSLTINTTNNNLSTDPRGILYQRHGLVIRKARPIGARSGVRIPTEEN